MPKISDWVICEPRLRYASNTSEGIALSYIKNHPSFKSPKDLIAQAIVAYWLPFGLSASGVEGQALVLACFEAIGELEKQINLIRRVLLEQETAIPGPINVPNTGSSPNTEVTIPSLDTAAEPNSASDSIAKTSAIAAKKAADLF